MQGQFARSIAGHDHGKLYIIIEETENEVFVADGILKLCEKPKRKNRKHIQMIKKECEYNKVILHKMKNHEVVSNEEVKRAIKLYELEVKHV